MPERREAGLIVQSEESLRLYALGALAWLAFVAFILTGLFTTVKQAPLIAIPFFGVFLFIAWKAAGKLLRSVGNYVNFGTVRLALEGAPTVGGVLKGAVEFEPGAAALAKLEAELVCTQEIESRQRKRTAPDPAVVVRTEKAELAVQVEPGHRRAPFAFAIPADAWPSGKAEDAADAERMPSYKWLLRLKAPNAGGDLERSYAVEVLPAGTPAPEPPSQEPASESAIALVVANMIPLALVLFGHGSVGALVVLYWAENVVIGFYTVLRMLESGRGAAGEKIGKSFFFCVHYGMFCFVHGIFIMALFLPSEQHAEVRALSRSAEPFGEIWYGARAIGLFSLNGLLLPLLALVVSHGVSFYTNYMRNGRYLTSTPQDSFMRPYPRMVLLHLFILGGAFFISQKGSAVLPLTVLVIGKTVMDFMLHRRSNGAG
jgi:hypothetical protein